MANVKLNPIIQNVRGHIGDLIFRRSNGAVIIGRMPETRGIFTDAQKAVQERFRQATIYGKMVMADEHARALYQEVAKKKGKPVFSLMIGDFFKAPSVDEIDLSSYDGQVGSKIRIRASDDFDVIGVTVVISDSTGALIEQGVAEKSAVDSGAWSYTASTSIAAGTAIRVDATATDRPGNKTTKTENK